MQEGNVQNKEKAIREDEKVLREKRGEKEDMAAWHEPAVVSGRACGENPVV